MKNHSHHLHNDDIASLIVQEVSAVFVAVAIYITSFLLSQVSYRKMDKIAGASKNLVLEYNPDWSGAGETIHQTGTENKDLLRYVF